MKPTTLADDMQRIVEDQMWWARVDDKSGDGKNAALDRERAGFFLSAVNALLGFPPT